MLQDKNSVTAAVKAMGKINGQPYSKGSLDRGLLNLQKAINEGLLCEPFTWEMIDNTYAYYVALAKQKNPDKQPSKHTSSTFKTVLRLEPEESKAKRKRECELRNVLARVAGVDVGSAEAVVAAREVLGA